MDYEKKYKEALTWMQSLYDGLHGATKKDAEHYFPELKESEDEDEKIRKRIINALHGDILGMEETYKAIAWLEKQGEQKQDPCDNCKDVMLNCHNFPCTKKRAFKQGKSVFDIIKEEKVDNANKVEPKFKIKYAGNEYNVLEVKDIAGVTFYGIEDEPNHIDYIKAENCKRVDGYNIKESGSLYPTKSAMFSKQNPIDKVEPKFKVGDWISGYYTNYKVLSVNNDGYLVEDVDGNKINILFENEKFHHLFTIADAKDGDVLVNGSNIFIFSHLSDTRAMGYCHINIDDGRFYDDKGKNECFGLIDAVFSPATKEQRDLLFQKMHEVGYEWDADKKELKKIEPKFHRGQWIIWQDKCYEVNYNGCGYELVDQNGLSTSLEYGTVDTSARLWDVTKDAKAGDVLVIQETDFTYESIFIFNKIENNHIIQYLHYFITDTDEEVCKVKSVGGFLGDVGDNVHPATKEQREQLEKAMADAGYAFDFDKKKLKKIEQKPAWSYEDEANLNNIIWLCNNCIKGSETTWVPSQATKIKHLMETIKEKGLVQQNPAWSEEDELYIRELESLVKQVWATAEHKNDKDTIHKMSDLSFFLKTLKPQSTWKPSDKQMKAFENFVKSIGESGYASPYANWITNL